MAATAAALAMLLSAAAQAQIRDEIPRTTYYLAIDEFYAGKYRSAERALRRETQRGVRTASARWIDSICHHAMLGEVLYHQGRNAEALAEFDQACRLLLAYPDWLLRVRFQQPPRPDANRARRAPPWGTSERQFTLGQFSTTEQVLVGELDSSRAVREGGVVRTPQLWRVNVAEIVRGSALAIRRRNEILGPLARHDPMSRELADVFSRGSLARPNHWSSAWIDLQRGVALAGIGKADQAAALLERAAIVDGRFDHPLTGVALLEQGRLAMERGDDRRAARLLAEASFSAFYYQNWGVLTESLMLGWLNHLGTGGAGVYPPLSTAATWAQANRLQHVAVKLRLANAESLVWLGQVAEGTAALEDATRRIGEMRNGLPGLHQLYVQAILQLVEGRIEPSVNLLQQALVAQTAASKRNFQIAYAGELFDARQVSPRVAVQLYDALLADPTPAEWVVQPLDAMAVLSASQGPAFDRWFAAALDRRDASLALEIAEQAKRRRFLARAPLGGRLLALRTILEAPAAELGEEAGLQRQQVLASFPAYRQLATAGKELERQLRGGPVLAQEADEVRRLTSLYRAWGENAQSRERLLFELALRRVPSTLEFPPLLTTDELQERLAEREALVAFHAAAGDLYGFLLSSDGAQIWRVGEERRLGDSLGTLLRELGHYGRNKTLSASELEREDWRQAAREVYAELFAGASLESEKVASLVVVPDGVLWYLPFELLTPPGVSSGMVWGDRVAMRYGPTAALALAEHPPARRTQHTGIVAGDVHSDTAGGSADAMRELEDAATGPVRLPSPLPQPAPLVAALLDELIVLDDLDGGRGSDSSWSLLPRSRGRAAALHAWAGLPHGGPQRIIATGFTTAAEQGLRTRRSEARDAAPGSEVFQTACTLMARGARTVLLTRWRTGGRTNLELVREFVQELPHASATDAWRRAVVLAREMPLDPSREPRLQRPDDASELPTADHPFFWAGYLLIDTGSQPVPDEPAAPDEEAPQSDAEEGEPAESKAAAPDPAML